MKKKIVLPSLSPVEAMKQILKKLFVFKGRSRRSEYWWGMSLSYCMLGVFSVTFVLEPGGLVYFPFYVLIGGLLWKCLLLPMGVRRLHDTGRSGWWAGGDFIFMFVYLFLLGYDEVKLLKYSGLSDDLTSVRMMGDSMFKYLWLHLLCCVSQLVLIVLMCFDSQKGENKYGKSPKYREVEEEVR